MNQTRDRTSTGATSSDATTPDMNAIATYDVVVVGGGAAGLSGALCLARARRSVLVVDDASPRNAPAGHVHNYLTRDGTPPAELLAAGRADAAKYGTRFRTATVTDVERLPGAAQFGLTLSDGSRVLARRLLVTTGVVDELPDVAGLRDHWGGAVLHCPYCHGWEVRDQRVVVIATGPLAVHQALMWRQWTSELTVVGPVPDDGLEELVARGITVVPGAVAAVVERDGRLTGLRLADGGVVPCDAVVVASRVIARSALLEQLGLATVDTVMAGQLVGTGVPADPFGATEVDGVWVAGNVTNLRAQVITSAAAGLDAGAAINGDLIAEETRIAVEARRRATAAATA